MVDAGDGASQSPSRHLHYHHQRVVGGEDRENAVATKSLATEMTTDGDDLVHQPSVGVAFS